MSQRSPELLKKAAGELAQYICYGAGNAEQANLLLQQLNAAIPVTIAKTAPPAPAVRRDTDIGIWKRSFTSRGAVYERDPKKKRHWHQWANVPKLYPKRADKRVILLGESVARGFFYDPYYTVATELEAVLNQAPGLPSFEVTDLARTNCDMQELLNLANLCRALDPDAVVIFAGNNWHHELYASFTSDDVKQLAQLVANRSAAEAQQFLEKKSGSLVQKFFEKLRAILPPDQLPCVFIIPGYNLADWKNSYYRRSFPWLPATEAESWFAHKDEAEKAIADKDYNKLMGSAQAMVTLDSGHPYGYQLLANAQLQQNDLAAAKKSLEICRDAALLHRGDNNYPVCFGFMREAISRAAEGFALVDAQLLYDEQSKNGIPGRHFFMDYCHLTIEGIKTTMCETAAVLLRQMGMAGKNSRVFPSTVEPAKEVMGIAHLSAAIHNAHRDQPYDIVLYHCKKAIAYSDDIKEPMLQVIDFSTRHASTPLCKSFGEIILSGRMQQYDGGFALQHPAGNKLMDIVLTDAITEALGSAGVDCQQKLATMRVREHGVRDKKLDLLQSFYSKTSYNNFPPAPIAPVFMKARHTQSDFLFVAEGARSLDFQLVYRVPDNRSANNKLRIIINDNNGCAVELPASTRWEAVAFTVPFEWLNDGVNHLSILWPRTAGLLEVPGELHSFSVVENS